MDKIQIYVWGAGDKCKKVLSALDENKCKVLGIIDNDPSKLGKSYNNLSIVKLEQISSKFDYIIISAVNFQAILHQISETDIREDKVIIYYSKFQSMMGGYDFIDIKQWKIDILEERLNGIEHKYEIRIRNMVYEVLEKINKQSINLPLFGSNEEALYKIINNGCSIIRFGDGEFNIMSGNGEPVFQKSSNILAIRLREVLKSDNEKLLIAIAKNYGDLSVYPDDVADGIREYMTDEIRTAHNSLLNYKRKYYDAYLFKCFIPHKDKENTDKRIQAVKSIWAGKDIVLIEGDKTRTGVGNDLLDNTKSIRRILCPTKNAWDRYDEIEEKALNESKDKLVLIALGPAGKVIGYDLFKNGYQVIDIGQMDMDYDWYLRGTGFKVGNKYKYVSQLPPAEITEIDNADYIGQIIAHIE